MSKIDNYKQELDTAVDRCFQEVFQDASLSLGLDSGDISPEQQQKVDELKDSLKNVVADWAQSNMTSDYSFEGFQKFMGEAIGSLNKLKSPSMADVKFSEYLAKMDDQAAAGMLRKSVFSMPEDKRREFIIEHCPEIREEVVHEKHCTPDVCKYGDEDCPVASKLEEWTVDVARTETVVKSILVKAYSYEDAEVKAIEKSGDVDFSGGAKEADYEVIDIQKA